MQKKTIITCAITGNITRPEQHPALPITPKQIAESALEAAKAGASVAHIHVRHPETGEPSMQLDHYREVIDRIREHNTELVLNLTTGPGGRFVPSRDDPRVAGPGTTLMAPERRVEHVAELKPDICTLDLNTMNSGGQVVINTPENVVRMARVIRAAGVKPELEIFDSGDLRLALDLMKQGELEGPGLFSLVLGVNYGFGADIATMTYARNMLPPDATWSAFGVGRHEFPMVALAHLLGGHVRVGFEDNIYMSKGVLAESNAQLVQRASMIIRSIGGEIATATQARQLLGLSS